MKFYRKRISQEIDSAASAFEVCWGWLVIIKSRVAGGESDVGELVLNFQPRLADALFALDRIYDELCSEERRLVGLRDENKISRFETRMKILARYKSAICDTVSIGKSLGDAFAWIFHFGDLSRITPHLDKPRQNHIPGGIGGRGELEFIRNVRAIKGYPVLYHGITSFLRAGDFSLIDLKTLKVIAIGELKTERIDDETLGLSLTLLSAEKLAEFSEPDNAQKETRPARRLDSKVNDRLRKQLKSIGKVINREEPSASLSHYNAYHVRELGELQSRLAHSKDIASLRIGKGLIAIAFRQSGDLLSERILRPIGVSEIQKRLPSAFLEIRSILLPDSNDNTAVIDVLSADLPLGSTPLFWWPVDLEFLHDIIFHRTWIVTIYNAAHLAQSLVSRGYLVHSKGNPTEWSLEKRLDGGRLAVPNFAYFIASIQKHFMKEESAIDMIENVEKSIREKKIQPGTQINLSINHIVLE